MPHTRASASPALLLRLTRPALEAADVEELARVASSCFGLDAVLALSASADAGARSVASLALGAIGHGAAVERALGERLLDPCAAVAAVAEHALRMLWMRGNGGPGVPAFEAGLRATEACNPSAAGHFEAAVALDPGFAEAHHQLGLVRVAQGSLAAAAPAFDAALGSNPRHFPALAAAGHLAATLGCFDRADTLYRRALLVHPTLEGVATALEGVNELLARQTHRRHAG